MAKDKKPDPKPYTADRDVYVGLKYYRAGEPFVTDDEPADFWTEVAPEVAQIIQASTNQVPADAPLESLGVEALKAVAVTKNVNVTDLNKQQLIDAIKAANEPRL